MSLSSLFLKKIEIENNNPENLLKFAVYKFFAVHYFQMINTEKLKKNPLSLFFMKNPQGLLGMVDDLFKNLTSQSSQRPSPPKIISLDEFAGLVDENNQTLRRAIQSYSISHHLHQLNTLYDSLRTLKNFVDQNQKKLFEKKSLKNKAIKLNQLNLLIQVEPADYSQLVKEIGSAYAQIEHIHHQFRDMISEVCQDLGTRLLCPEGFSEEDTLQLRFGTLIVSGTMDGNSGAYLLPFEIISCLRCEKTVPHHYLRFNQKPGRPYFNDIDSAIQIEYSSAFQKVEKIK